MKKKVFICGCKTGGKITSETVAKWESVLIKNNIGYTFIEDLCGTAVKNPQDLLVIKDHEESVILGCNSRAMEHVLFKAGIRMCCAEIDFYNMETDHPTILSEINAKDGGSNLIPYKHDWKSWYPVIDYSKCSSCQKCLNFCLFGVYKTDEFGNVLVDQPSNCKDMCPACARTCPEQAIIFPKHPESPIDGGEGQLEVLSQSELIEQIQQNEDVYKILADRRKQSGVSLLKDQEKIAEAERSCCVSKDENQKTEITKKDDSEKSSGCSCGCNC